MSEHAIVVRPDARAMSAVTALDTRVSARWQASNAEQRTFNGKRFSGTSECVSYYLDDNGDITDAKVFRNRKSNRTPNKYNAPMTAPIPRRVIMCGDLAPIGNIL